MDDISHDRSIVQVLDSFLRPPCAGEEHLGQAQVLAVLGVIKDLNLLNITILFAHISQEGFLDVVIEPGKGHLLQRDLAHIEFIQLKLWDREGKVSVFGPHPVPGIPQVTHRSIAQIIRAEVHPIIAIDLVGGPLQHGVNNELVVSPLKIRGFLEVTPTFLIHSDSFTLLWIISSVL